MNSDQKPELSSADEWLEEVAALSIKEALTLSQGQGFTGLLTAYQTKLLRELPMLNPRDTIEEKIQQTETILLRVVDCLYGLTNHAESSKPACQALFTVANAATRKTWLASKCHPGHFKDLGAYEEATAVYIKAEPSFGNDEQWGRYVDLVGLARKRIPSPLIQKRDSRSGPCQDIVEWILKAAFVARNHSDVAGTFPRALERTSLRYNGVSLGAILEGRLYSEDGRTQFLSGHGLTLAILPNPGPGSETRKLWKNWIVAVWGEIEGALTNEEFDAFFEAERKQARIKTETSKRYGDGKSASVKEMIRRKMKNRLEAEFKRLA